MRFGNLQKSPLLATGNCESFAIEQFNFNGIGAVVTGQIAAVHQVGTVNAHKMMRRKPFFKPTQHFGHHQCFPILEE